MVKYREIIRLGAEKYSMREIASRVGHSHHTIKDVLERASKNSLKWPLNEDVTDKELEAYYKKHSVLDMVRNMPEDQKKPVRWFIDCGDDDFLFEGNSLVHIEMRKNNIPHEFRIRNGGHTWTYWRESLPVVLSFISDAFHQY